MNDIPYPSYDPFCRDRPLRTGEQPRKQVQLNGVPVTPPFRRDQQLAESIDRVERSRFWGSQDDLEFRAAVTASLKRMADLLDGAPKV